MTFFSALPQSITNGDFRSNFRIATVRIWFILLVLIPLNGNGQDTLKIENERFSVHAQTTIINQLKPSFSAKYSGQNSLVPEKETSISVTSTMFLGARLWNGASVFTNPEIAAGSGLSGSLGVGASANGETYKAGGLRFELGDGNLSYGLESLAEFYYSFALTKSLYMSGTYQFINNPGYNKDRGPVNVFSIRAHIII